MAIWKSKLADKLPKLTRKQILFIIIFLGVLIVFIFIPITFKYGSFSCDKQGIEVRKK